MRNLLRPSGARGAPPGAHILCVSYDPGLRSHLRRSLARGYTLRDAPLTWGIRSLVLARPMGWPEHAAAAAFLKCSPGLSELPKAEAQAGVFDAQIHVPRKGHLYQGEHV